MYISFMTNSCLKIIPISVASFSISISENYFNKNGYMTVALVNSPITKIEFIVLPKILVGDTEFEMDFKFKVEQKTLSVPTDAEVLEIHHKILNTAYSMFSDAILSEQPILDMNKLLNDICSVSQKKIFDN